MIKLIAAVSSDNIIGTVNNEIPWCLPNDLKRFKELTTGSVLVMGSNTFASLGSLPLKGRVAAVLTRKVNNKKIKDVEYFNSPIDLLEHDWKGKNLWICGGGEIYNLLLNTAEELYITLVHTDIGLGIRFPKIDEKIWESIRIELGQKENNLTYDFITYRKKHVKKV